MADAFILLVLASALGVTASFGLRLGNSATFGDLPTTGVVFTGQFDRIRLGLDLMTRHEIRRLFISGVNRGAGLNPDTFARQFDLSSSLAAELASGGIILATEADNTFQNACETAQWLAGRPDITRILLITSRTHMPRASLALDRAVGSSVSIERLSVDAPANETPAAFLREFFSFAKTLAAPFLPNAVRPDDRSGPCRPA